MPQAERESRKLHCVRSLTETSSWRRSLSPSAALRTVLSRCLMRTFHIGFNLRIVRRQGGWQDRVRPEAKEDDHASVLLHTLLLHHPWLIAEKAGVMSLSNRELLRRRLMPVLQFLVNVTKSLFSSTTSALIRWHGSCLCADAHLKIRRSVESRFLTNIWGLCWQTWGSSLALLPLPKMAPTKTRTVKVRPQVNVGRQQAFHVVSPSRSQEAP